LIIKEYGKFTLICDICDKQVGGFDTWQEAVDYKKTADWMSKKVDGEYQDICGCREEN